MGLRIYMTGRVCVEFRDTIVEERHLAGRQGRITFAYLVVHRHRPATRNELAENVWQEGRPVSWSAALSATISKLRGVFTSLGLQGGDLLVQTFGGYQLVLPEGTSIDVHTAAQSLEDAQAAQRSGQISEAWSAAVVAATIARRPFLPGEEAPWIDTQRGKLRRMLIRSLNILAEVTLAKGDYSMAQSVAEEAVDLEPLHELAHQQLMRAHHLSGNTAEAVRVYNRLCELLDTLSVEPSRATQAIRLQVARDVRTAGGVRLARTFMFTDIVGSTRLLETIGDRAWSDLVRWHDDTLRTCFLTHNGEEIDRAGDGFFVAFENQTAAIDCAIGIQRALYEHRRDHGFAPHLRIGLHSSEATAEAGGYSGKGVHEAARIGALAEAGEIVASVATITSSDTTYGFAHQRKVNVKGISTPLEVATVNWR
ncbi:MAG: BTAD domain-containing putative transcriptional regulator [Actinomycetota bacterium]